MVYHAPVAPLAPGPTLEWYAGFDWLNENYLRAEREDDRDRYYFEGRDFSLTSSNRLDIGNTPFIALQLEARY